VHQAGDLRLQLVSGRGNLLQPASGLLEFPLQAEGIVTGAVRCHAACPTTPVGIALACYAAHSVVPDKTIDFFLRGGEFGKDAGGEIRAPALLQDASRRMPDLPVVLSAPQITHLTKDPHLPVISGTGRAVLPVAQLQPLGYLNKRRARVLTDWPLRTVSPDSPIGRSD